MTKRYRIKKAVVHYFDGITLYALFLTAKIPSFAIRNLLYRKIFQMNIQKETIIYAGCEIRAPYNISIGRSVIGPNNILDGRSGIEIGDHVCTGSGVKVWTLQHDPQSPTFDAVGGKVVIEDYAWIASFPQFFPIKRFIAAQS